MYRLLFILVLAPTGACVPDSGDEGILITKNVVPGVGCVVSADPNEPFLGHGTMSTYIPSDYTFVAQMKSRITASDDQIDTRTIFTTGANVDLSFPDTTFFTTSEIAEMQAAGITRFKTLFTAPIAPNGGITDASFSIVPEALFEKIYAKAPESRVYMPDSPRFALEVVASITVVGTLAGDTIDSQPFQYPITISNRDVAVFAGECELAADTELSLGNACGFPQDGTVTCCYVGTQAVCPGVLADPKEPPV